jgi:hypothetical protein
VDHVLTKIISLVFFSKTSLTCSKHHVANVEVLYK